MFEETNPESIEEVPRSSEQLGSTQHTTGRAPAAQGKAAAKSSEDESPIPQSSHVLFGRGRACNENPGNQRMRRIINKYEGQYQGTRLRVLKRKVLKKVYDEIVEGGVKFLKQVGNGNQWVEVKAELAIEKVSHSLRCQKGLNKGSTQEESRANRKGTKLRTRISPEIKAEQEVINHHQISSTVSTQWLEREVLRHPIVQHPPGDSSRSLLIKSLLLQQLQTERLRTIALIQSLPLTHSAVTSVPELQALNAIERDQELRRIMALRGHMFRGL